MIRETNIEQPVKQEENGSDGEDDGGIVFGTNTIQGLTSCNLCQKPVRVLSKCGN